GPRGVFEQNLPQLDALCTPPHPIDGRSCRSRVLALCCAGRVAVRRLDRRTSHPGSRDFSASRLLVNGETNGGLSSQSLRWVAFGLVAFVILVVVSGLTLVSRGQEEMRLSDQAFDDGDLRRSIFHARKAALSFVPGAEHVENAYERLD